MNDKEKITIRLISSMIKDLSFLRRDIHLNEASYQDIWTAFEKIKKDASNLAQMWFVGD